MGDAQTVLTKESITWKYLFWLECEQEIARYKYKTERGKKQNWEEGQSLISWEATCVTEGNLSHSPSFPSLHGVLKEASDCTDTRRLKTLLSFTVIPPHKSVLSHPRCTDKATKHRLIHTRSGEKETFFSFSFISCLSRFLSHSLLPTLLSVFHSSDLNSRQVIF